MNVAKQYSVDTMMPRVCLNVLSIFPYVGRVLRKGVKSRRLDTTYGYMRMGKSLITHGKMHGASFWNGALRFPLRRFDTALVAEAIHQKTAIQVIHVAGL